MTHWSRSDTEQTYSIFLAAIKTIFLPPFVYVNIEDEDQTKRLAMSCVRKEIHTAKHFGGGGEGTLVMLIKKME